MAVEMASESRSGQSSALPSSTILGTLPSRAAESSTTSPTSKSVQSHPAQSKSPTPTPEKSELCRATRSSTRLTASALEVHNSFYDERIWEQMEDERIERLQKAAQELGFELPRSCYYREEW